MVIVLMTGAVLKVLTPVIVSVEALPMSVSSCAAFGTVMIFPLPFNSVAIVGRISVLLANVSVVDLATSVSVLVGSVRVPVLVIVLMTGAALKVLTPLIV